MGFFIRNRNKRDQSGRKNPASTREPPSKLPKRRVAAKEEEISSDDDDEVFNDARNARFKEYSDDEYEDVQTRAFREAKQLLEKVKADEEQEGAGSDEDEDGDDAIAHRLIKDAQSKLGLLFRHIAKDTTISDEEPLIYRPHRFSPVALAVSSDNKFVVSCSKDGSVVKYDIQKKEKVSTLKYTKTAENNNHRGVILAVAISPDNRYLVTGGADSSIKVWNFDKFTFVRNLGSHRGPVTSLVFRQYGGPPELFSGSKDRCIKVWNMEQMGLADTLYGHQDGIMQLDMLAKPRIISCGGQDRTVRIFKVMEESQLVFNGSPTCVSIDTVAFIDDNHFISGSADGSVSIWAGFRKKPLFSVKEAHGKTAGTTLAEARWITAVAAAPNTDLVASGSHDGLVRLWRVTQGFKSLEAVDEFKIAGFVNAMRFIENGRKLVIAVGQEHKNGRWWKEPTAKNCIVVLSLVNNAATTKAEEERP